MKSLDLFSCIGCHAIGFERAGIQTIAFHEIDRWRAAKIEERFPEVPQFYDAYSSAPWKADIVIGGPPCQRTSVAAAIHGYRNGDSDWPAMRTAVWKSLPTWVVVEQPPGNPPWEAAVIADLCEDGFDVARFEFGACDVGAPYLRRRVFLVACTSLSRLEIARRALPSAIEGVKRAANARGDWDPDQLATLPVDARAAGEFDYGPASAERQRWIEALGDSNPPHMAEAIGRAIAAAVP